MYPRERRGGLTATTTFLFRNTFFFVHLSHGTVHRVTLSFCIDRWEAWSSGAPNLTIPKKQIYCISYSSIPTHPPIYRHIPPYPCLEKNFKPMITSSAPQISVKSRVIPPPPPSQLPWKPTNMHKHASYLHCLLEPHQKRNERPTVGGCLYSEQKQCVVSNETRGLLIATRPRKTTNQYAPSRPPYFLAPFRRGCVISGQITWASNNEFPFRPPPDMPNTVETY